VLSWSAPFLVFNFLLQINFQILGGTGKVKERLKIITAGLACNVPLNLLLIPMFGISGSALAVGLSWIPVWYLSNRAIGPSAIAFDWKFFGKNLFFMGTVSILSFWAWHLPSVYPFFSTRINVVVGLSILTFVHIISFVLVNFAESRELLREILAMLPKKKSSA
jgi:O-antigen/teichoic acid export membrane protein